MQGGSLLLWLKHFPVTNEITQNFMDSCPGSSPVTTIGVVAGQNFEQVMAGVQGNYHILMGSCPTVSLSGGWLHGGGLGTTSRQYGYGVDSAVSFDVVLADGSLVTADACTHSDLFWALRGGGGGNFGIVVKAQYRLYPATPITYLPFKFRNDDFIRSWMNFLLDVMPTADTRWGGSWGPDTSKLTFVGSIEEARASDFMAAINAWYDREVVPLNPPFNRPSEELLPFSSLYEASSLVTDSGRPLPSPQLFGNIGPFTRILTTDVFEQGDWVRDELIEMGVNGELFGAGNYFLGGRTNEPDESATAMHPGMRRAVFMVQVLTNKAREKLAEIAGNDVACMCYNHNSPQDPDWENAAWGDNYMRLMDIKQTYDPNHLFNVYRGVDYRDPDDGYAEGCPRRWRNLTLIPLALFFIGMDLLIQLLRSLF